MKIFPENSNKTLKSVGYIVVVLSILGSISRGILDALINGLFWWFAFWVVAKISQKNFNHDKGISSLENISGESKTKKSNYIKIGLILLVLVILVLVGLASLGQARINAKAKLNSDNYNSQVKKEEGKNLCTNQMEYSAKEIYDQYKKNPYRTKNNFKNSCIGFTSKITEISSENNFVVLETQLDSVSTNYVKFICSTFKEEDMMKINLGDDISIVGKVILAPDINEVNHFLSLALHCQIKS